MKVQDVVKDGSGNHFIVVSLTPDGLYVRGESVATREVYTLRTTDLSPTDRVVF